MMTDTFSPKVPNKKSRNPNCDDTSLTKSQKNPLSAAIKALNKQ